MPAHRFHDVTVTDETRQRFFEYQAAERLRREKEQEAAREAKAQSYDAFRTAYAETGGDVEELDRDFESFILQERREAEKAARLKREEEQKAALLKQQQAQQALVRRQQKEARRRAFQQTSASVLQILGIAICFAVLGSLALGVPGAAIGYLGVERTLTAIVALACSGYFLYIFNKCISEANKHHIFSIIQRWNILMDFYAKLFCVGVVSLILIPMIPWASANHGGVAYAIRYGAILSIGGAIIGFVKGILLRG
jgi:hypothetical protein